MIKEEMYQPPMYHIGNVYYDFRPFPWGIGFTVQWTFIPTGHSENKEVFVLDGTMAEIWYLIWKWADMSPHWKYTVLE